MQCLPQSISETYEAKGKSTHKVNSSKQAEHQHRGTLQYINAGGNSHLFIGAFVLSTNAFLLINCIYHHHADAPSQVVSSCAFSTLELKLAALSRSTFIFVCFFLAWASSCDTVLVLVLVTLLPVYVRIMPDSLPVRVGISWFC